MNDKIKLELFVTGHNNVSIQKTSNKERHVQLCKICVSAQKLYVRTYHFLPHQCSIVCAQTLYVRTYLVCALIIIAYEDMSFF